MSEYSTTNGSYVEWAPIIGGAVLASALSLVLLQFGSAVGAADMNTFRDSASNIDITPARILLATLYILIIQVLASMIGGYIAGRMRAPISGSEHEREIRDGIHGVLTWATASLAVAVTVALAAAFAQLAVDKPAEVEQAKAVVDAYKNVPIILAFSAGATSLVSAVAAWVAGVKGGDHRDRSVDYSRYVTFLVRR